MLFFTFARENLAHLLALLCLVVGLSDASTLVGLRSGAENPAVLLGTVGFILLAAFTIARLFSAVGIWINASWGGMLLVSTSVLELASIATGLSTAPYSFFGIVFRILLAFGVAYVFILRWWRLRNSVHD